MGNDRNPKRANRQNNTFFSLSGLEKCEDVSECWKEGGGASNPPASLIPSLSPDLGFVDCQDVAYKSACDKKLPFVCLPTLKATTLKAEVRLSAMKPEGSHRLPPILHDGPRRYAYPRPDNNRRFAPILPAKSAKNTLLKTHKNLSVGKKVTVEIEKLPNKMMSSLTEASVVANDIFLINSVSSRQPALASKSRFDIVRTAKEISLQKGGLVALSTYRSQKASVTPSVTPSTDNSISFTTRTFYSSSSNNVKTNNKLKSESVSKISSKTESCESRAPSEPFSRSCSLSSSTSDASSIISSQPGSQDSISEPTSAAGSEIGEEPAVSSESGDVPVRPFRFPTLAGNTSAIPCKWNECGQGFKSHAKLSDHIKVKTSLFLWSGIPKPKL